MPSRDNVLLVVLDSVRARNTSLHGYDRATTPFLDSFADRATTYRQARAPSIHSIASHVSMFTGAHVEQHEASYHTAQIDPTETVWRTLRDEARYATGLFTSNRIVASASNLSDAFDHVSRPTYPLSKRLENVVDGTVLKRAYFHAYRAVASLRAAADRLQSRSTTLSRLRGAVAGRQQEQAKPNRTGAGAAADDSSAAAADEQPDVGFKSLFGGKFVDAFLDWEADRDRPWAACLNLMDAHSPYQPRAEFNIWADETHRRIQREELPSVWQTLNGTGWEKIEALEPLYDGAIRQTDAIVERLVGALKRRGVLSDTVIIITSDHGEGFGEQSRLADGVRLRGHKWGIHEALTHVPLVISYPDRDGGTVVDAPVSLTDLPAVARAAAAETDTGATDPLTGTGADRVLASTFRQPAEKLAKFGAVEGSEAYIGPWRAVYEPVDGTSDIRKYAQHDDDHLTLRIAGDDRDTAAVTIGSVSTAPHEQVAQAYGGMSDDEILVKQQSEIGDELEERLEDLGYIR